MEKRPEERRKYPRALFPCKLTITTQGRPLISHTENISSGGMRVMLEENLKYYPCVGIEISINRKRTIECEGKVAWVREKCDPIEGQAVMFDTGIEFVKISDDDRQYLERMIGVLLSEK